MILDPIFIFASKMEITGATVATMLSNAAATVYFFVFLFKIRKSSTITPSPSGFTLGRGIPAEVLTVGLPGFLMMLMRTLSNLTLNQMRPACS